MEERKKAFEYARKDVMKELSGDQQKFTARMILSEVKRIAEEHGISEEKAYWGYTHGLYGGDREV